MRWFTCKKEDLVGLELINPYNNKHVIRLIPNSKNLELSEGEESDTRFVAMYIKNKPTVEDVKSILVSLQKEYDSDIEVNSFYINDKREWFDKSTRLGLLNLINIEKSNGKETTTIWFNNGAIDVNIDTISSVLQQIELYAKQCFNVTKQHIEDINNFTTIEECLNFDITKDYPEVLHFQL